MSICRHLVRILGASLVLQAGVSQAADLAAVYQDARLRDPAFESASRTLSATRERLPQARAGLLPSVSLSGNSRRTKSDVSFDGASEVERDVRTGDLRLELTQPLFRAQNIAAYGQASWQVTQAEAQFAQAEQDLILRVAQAYFDVLTAQEALTAAEAQEAAMRAQLNTVTESRRAGTAAMTEVHEARSRTELAAAAAIAARSELQIRRSALRQIVGSVPGQLAPLREGANLPSPDPLDIDAWIKAAEEASPLVRVQEAALEVAEREVWRARGGHLPNIDLTASRVKDDSDGSATSPTNLATESDQKIVGVQFSWPLWSSGATSARVREAKELEYKGRSDLETAKRAAAHIATQAYTGVVNGLAQVKAMEQAVVSSKNAVEGNKIGYKVGTRINVDVLNAEQQLYSAQRDLAKARYDTVVQILKLKAAAGQLNETDLTTMNSLLAPE